MGSPHTGEQQFLGDIVRPFANLLADPLSIPFGQEFRSLQLYYGAHDHPDFTDRGLDEIDIVACLPFTLALGLHPTGPSVLRDDDVARTYNSYTWAVQPTTEEESARRQRTEIAKGLLTRTIVTAALGPKPAAPNQLRAATNFVRKVGWLSGREARSIARVTGLITDRVQPV